MSKKIKDTNDEQAVSLPSSEEPNILALRISGQNCLIQFFQKRTSIWAKEFAELLVGKNGWQSLRCAITWRLKESKFSRWYFKLQANKSSNEKVNPSTLLPTVVAWDGRRSGEIVESRRKIRPSGQKYSASLNDLAKSGLLPTPTAGGDKTGNMGKTAMDKRIADGRQEDLNMKLYKLTGQTGKLNPSFIMEMMGFPIQWTLNPFLK